jgi:hypothetical protein
VRPRHCALATTAALTLMLTACGTTARLTGNSGGGSGLDVTGQTGGTPTAGGGVTTRTTGVGGPQTGGPSSGLGGASGINSVAGGSGASGSNGQSTGTGFGSTSGNGSTGPGAVGQGPAGTSGVPGLTATTITIGFAYAVETGAANSAIGANGVSQGPTQQEAQTMINYLNQHGGVAGRKIIPIWYQESATSFSSIDAVDQGECQQDEVDHHVFAIFDGGNPIIEQCAQQAGAVAINDNIVTTASPTFRRFPSYFELNSPDLDRIALNEVQGLNAQHYFAPWDASLSRAGTTRGKVGVFTFSSPDFDYAVNTDLLPALARAGYAPSGADVVRVAQPQSTSDVSGEASAASSAVLKFRTDGVDHVIVFDANGTLSLFFMNNANGQRYYPRYGFNSQNGPEILASSGDVPQAQLNGALGIGWDPILDLASAQDPDSGPYSNVPRRACLALMSAHGYAATDNNSKTIQVGICTQFDFLKTVLDAAGPTISQATFIAAANRLGYWNGAGDALGNYFGATQHDGGAYYRYYDWNGGCTCMEYNGSNQIAVGEGES